MAILEKIKDYYKENKEKNKTFKSNIPNILTASRLIAPIVIIPLVATGNIIPAVIATSLFAATDFVDGKLARKWDTTSKFGAMLDTISDKVFATTLLVSGTIINPFLIFNISLEALISIINIEAFKKNIETGSSRLGKVKTWLLFGNIISTFIPSLNANYKHIISLGTSGFQLITLFDYYEKINENSIKKEGVVREPIIEELDETPTKKLEKEKVIDSTRKERIAELRKNIDELNELMYEYKAAKAKKNSPTKDKTIGQFVRQKNTEF